MTAKYSVPLAKLIKDNSYELIYSPKDTKDIYISSKEVGRPGLVLTGYFEYFEPARVQYLGLNELGYIKSLGEEDGKTAMERLFSCCPALIVITRGLDFPGYLIELAEKYEVPIIRTDESTSSNMSMLISYLGVELADRITRHGVLVEVYGQGVLIVGDSGVGKSETALELIKRGHRLIADDAVEIRKVSARTLVGSSPDNIRHFIELRGVGVINARRIFGMGAIKMTEKIDLVIELEHWDDSNPYDRMGLDNEYTEILGIKIPMVVVPIRPGRNLSIIIEAATMNNRQKEMGYNAAKELLHNLGMDDEIVAEERKIEAWHNY
ncbi:MAG: HPr(Ser) kinase/phosphatase [Clostridiales bacterium]|nr:HPr(Ser) kinase/phosphatase [Clostridiales bacterium]